LREIREGRAIASREVPNKWQVRVPLQDTTSRPALSGHAHFEVRLASPNLLPKREDWPK
jgi:hypothetical protein